MKFIDKWMITILALEGRGLDMATFLALVVFFTLTWELLSQFLPKMFNGEKEEGK